MGLFVCTPPTEELGVEQLCSLLAMADLYLMEGLKNAVAPLLSKMLELDNILGISRLAEKHTATKLRERCCSFIFANADTMSPQLMDDLALAWEGLPSEVQSPGFCQQDFTLRPTHGPLQEKG